MKGRQRKRERERWAVVRWIEIARAITGRAMGRDGAGPRSQGPAQLNTGLAAAAMIHRSYLNYSGPGGRHANNGQVRLHSAPLATLLLSLN